MNTPAIIATSIGALLLLVITALVTFFVFPAQPNPVFVMTDAQPPPGTMGALENAQPNPIIVVTAAPTTAPPSLRRQPTTNFDARRSAFINALKTRKQKRILAQAYSNAEKELKGAYIFNPINYIKKLDNLATLRVSKSKVPGYTPHSRRR